MSGCDDIVEKIKVLGKDVYVLSVDLSDVVVIELFVKEVLVIIGCIDILVNNGGMIYCVLVIEFLLE